MRGKLSIYWRTKLVGETMPIQRSVDGILKISKACSGGRVWTSSTRYSSVQIAVTTLSLPPANNCSFTTNSSRTIQSGANSAKSSVWREPAMVCERKPGRSVRSAPQKPPFHLNPRKVAPCFVGHASSNGDPRFQLQSRPAQLPRNALSLPLSSGPCLLEGSRCA
jgi:hypothetical protein